MIFDYARADSLGKPIEILIPEPLRTKHKEAHVPRWFADPKTREMGVGIKLMGVKSNGQEFAVKIKLAPLGPVPGVRTHAMAVIRPDDSA